MGEGKRELWRWVSGKMRERKKGKDGYDEDGGGEEGYGDVLYECKGEGEGEEKKEKVREGKRGNDMDGET